MAKTYGISKRKDGIAARHVLVCVQGICLTARRCSWPLSAATELGFAVSAFQIIVSVLPFLLLISSLGSSSSFRTEEPNEEENAATRRELVQKTRIVAAQRFPSGPAVAHCRDSSLLDTFSCVFQGILPYGAQMLVAISAAAELGFAVSAFQIIPFLFYPFLLLISSLVFIFLVPDKADQQK